MFSFNFYLGKASQKPVLVTIYLRVRNSVSGDLYDINLGQKIDPKAWDAHKQLAKGRNLKTDSLNRVLLLTKERALGAVNEAAIRRTALTRDILELAIFGERRFEEAAPPSLFNLTVEFIKAKKGVLSFGTLNTYRTLAADLDEFGADKATFVTLIGERLFDRWQSFLLDKKQNTNATVNKKNKRIKAVLKWAQRNKMVHDDYTPHFKMLNTAKSKTVYLTESDIAKLQAANLEDLPIGYAHARDLFILQAYTGLRTKT